LCIQSVQYEHASRYPPSFKTGECEANDVITNAKMH